MNRNGGSGRLRDSLGIHEGAVELPQLHVGVGQLHMQQEHWVPAQQSLRRALGKGGLRDEGTAHLLLGNSQYELGLRNAAQQSFHRARQHDSTKASAERWIAVMKGEDDSCPTGGEAACKLIPGRR